jgi:hypothetical protein
VAQTGRVESENLTIGSVEGTNRPLTADDLTKITLLPEAKPGEPIRAVGSIAPAPPGCLPPEERTRQIRGEA